MGEFIKKEQTASSSFINEEEIGISDINNVQDFLEYIKEVSDDSSTALNNHIEDLNNPHVVNKTQLGLNNVDNTSDLNKPISTATQTALNAKSNTTHNHTSGTRNISLGDYAGDALTTGTSNIAIGVDALTTASTNGYNTAIGERSLYGITAGARNISVGYYAMEGSTSNDNVAVGYHALRYNRGNFNIGIGNYSLTSTIGGSPTQSGNTAIGYFTMNLYRGGGSTVIGYNAMGSATTTSSHNNVAIGYGAMLNAEGTVGSSVAIGKDSLTNGGNYNCSIGVNSAKNLLSTTQYNTGIGYNALVLKIDATNNTSFNNCSGLGANTRVSGDSQVQLGDSTTTTYAYGAIQDRSDMRDKTDIIDNPLGLDFILALQPKQFVWNYRDDYYVEMPVLNENGEPTFDENNNPITEMVFNEAGYNAGTLKRSRKHNGFIAQDVQTLIENGTIQDFAGLQSHNINGGCDIMSLGYTEFISPLVKAIQELNQKIEQLENRISVLEV
jgi:trimeric autotransporter adhesin